MRRLLRPRFVRFVLAGVLNTAFSYGVYAFFLRVGLSYMLANLMALLLGVAFSFFVQSNFVFADRRVRLIFRFAACWGVIYLFNIAIISALLRFGLNAYVAGALAMAPVTVASYLVQRLLVFRVPHGGQARHSSASTP